MRITLNNFLRATLLTTGCLLGIAPQSKMMADESETGISLGAILIADNLKSDEVLDIVAYSLVMRSWQLRSKTADRVVGYLKHRGREATVTFVVNGDLLDVFCDGYRIDKSGNRKRTDVPEGWIANLRKDITKRASLKAAMK